MSPGELFFDKLRDVATALDRFNASPAAIDDLESLLDDTDVRREFFRKLSDPEWVVPLDRRGYFSSPPGARQLAGGNLQYPTWPESQYLARVAARSATEVATIFGKLSIDNPFIAGDLLKAAAAMPANEAARLVPAVCVAATKGILSIHFKDAADLCVRLSDAGEIDAAMKLADGLFTPRFEQGQEEPIRRDSYWYKEGLKDVTPRLSVTKSHEFLPKLCEWLDASVKAKKLADADSRSDYSWIWRPAVEEHQQNYDFEFAGVMVGFVRDGFEQAILAGNLSLAGALQVLESYSYAIFKRLGIHLLSEFGKAEPEVLRQAILSREFLDGYEYKHEYARLVGRHLSALLPQERELWFSLVDAGPSHDGDADRGVIDATRQERDEWWKYEKLHWARAVLEGKHREFYERMRNKHGEPDLADLNSRTTFSRWGDESPVAVDQLTAMTFEEAVEAVSRWQPDGPRLVGPSLDGITSTFSEYVATDPEQFSSWAGYLEGRPAGFVGAFIRQMGIAVSAGIPIDISAVMRLCRWVVERPVEGALELVREEVSRFIEYVCKATDGDKPRYPVEELRVELWQLIEQLCRDRSASYMIRDVSQDDPRLSEYLELGINSPRGRAVVAAFDYARWVANHIKEMDGKREIVRGGFDIMPEVREMLQWQIASRNRTVEVFAIIGSRIGLIYWIDEAWLAGNSEHLFNLQGLKANPPAAEGWAAWNAFLVWVGPHVALYRLFRSQFAYAVEQAAQVESIERARQQPMNQLGVHLMTLYGRGQLGLNDDGGLLRRFIESAHPDIRRHAIGFVGGSLEVKGEVPADVLDRFMSLWDFYWAGPGRKDAKEDPDAWLFGPWFSCGKFPPAWSLERLWQFVEVAPAPEPDRAIAERLSEIADTDILTAQRILDRVVRSDAEGWRIAGWCDAAKPILRQAMDAGGDARQEAEALINHFGRRGYIEFGELLRHN